MRVILILVLLLVGCSKKPTAPEERLPVLKKVTGASVEAGEHDLHLTEYGVTTSNDIQGVVKNVSDRTLMNVIVYGKVYDAAEDLRGTKQVLIGLRTPKAYHLPKGEEGYFSLEFDHAVNIDTYTLEFYEEQDGTVINVPGTTPAPVDTIPAPVDTTDVSFAESRLRIVNSGGGVRLTTGKRAVLEVDLVDQPSAVDLNSLRLSCNRSIGIGQTAWILSPGFEFDPGRIGPRTGYEPFAAVIPGEMVQDGCDYELRIDFHRNVDGVPRYAQIDEDLETHFVETSAWGIRDLEVDVSFIPIVAREGYDQVALRQRIRGYLRVWTEEYSNPYYSILPPDIGHFWVSGDAIVTGNSGDLTGPQANYVLTLIEDYWEETGSRPDHFVVGVLKDATMGAGWAFISSNVALVALDDDPKRAARTVIHELGHCFGMNHVYCPNMPEEGEYEENYPDPNGIIYHDTYDVGRENWFEVYPRSSPRYDIMSYCQPYWVSRHTYDNMARNLSQRIRSVSARVLVGERELVTCQF